MPDQHLVSAVEQVDQPRQVRPHLVILGAGASRAAFPSGDLNGRRLPLMADFTEIVPVTPILEESRIDWRGKNFEELYTLLEGNPSYGEMQHELEDVVFNYFRDLQLPDAPTLYDELVLSLRPKDVIATFNWDPFLVQACQRSAQFTESLPCLLFMHGNVAHGYCDQDSSQGPRDASCPRCQKPFKPDKLLFPVARKDYSSDPSIRKSWEVLREALREVSVVTVFGYAAPASDKDALTIMSEAWGSPEKRQLEFFEMIDIRPPAEVGASWKEFTYSSHYRVYATFEESVLANHPRRSGEAYINRFIHARWLQSYRVVRAKTLRELHSWFQPLIEAEQRQGI